MKKLLTGLILIALGLTSFGQVDTVEIATLRQSEKGGRAATRIQNANDLLLQAKGDSSVAVFNYRDSIITDIRFIDFDLDDGWSMQEGRAGWNDDDKTLEIGLDQGSVLQIGQEVHVRAVNKTGVQIDDGTVVYVSGAQGNRPTIGLASDTSATAILTIGLATQDIGNNNIGYVTLIGLVRGYDTRNFRAGNIVWLGTTPGTLDTIRPSAPNIAVNLGVALNSTEEGIIAVRPTIVQRLSWLSDVSARDNQSDNNLLVWNEVSLLWKADSVVTLDSINTRVLDYNPPHGIMVFSDSAVVLDLTQNIWAKVTNDYDSLYAIIEADGILVDGDSMTIVTPGDYLMLVTMSFDGNTQDNYHMAIYVNSVITRFESHRKTSNNDTGYFGINGYLDNLAAGDDVCLKIRNTINNNDPTFISSQIIMEMSHPR